MSNRNSLLALITLVAFGGCAVDDQKTDVAEDSEETEVSEKNDQKEPRPDKTPLPEESPAPSTPDDPESPDPTPTTPDDSCQWAHDGECDEPTYCAEGTDFSDCSGEPIVPGDYCQYANDGVCDGPPFCPVDTDLTDCSAEPLEPGDTCQYANDGECDEPTLCPELTDETDCAVDTGNQLATFWYTATFHSPEGEVVESRTVYGQDGGVATNASCNFSTSGEFLHISMNLEEDIFLSMQLRVSNPAGGCEFSNSDFANFKLYDIGVENYHMESGTAYSPMASASCSDTGMDGDYMDLSFEALGGLHPYSATHDGTEPWVTISEGWVRCYW